VWAKGRNGSTDNALFDIVRGTGVKVLESNLADAENNYGLTVNSFDANGFTTSAGSFNHSYTNNNGTTYVGWAWKANGAGVTNTAGTITSTVSANTSAGFSIVTYTEPSGTFSFGHGLGVAPAMIIIKDRGTTGNWIVWHKSIGTPPTTAGMYFNSTLGVDNTGSTWLNSVTSSVIQTTSGQFTGTGTKVAYCFAEVAGYSKFGSYTGNGSTDGTFVHTGFRPAFVLTKCSSTTGNWMITDDARNPSNLAGEILMPNNSDTEYSQDGIDMLSNGFKLRASTSNRNGNGSTYIYMAFAENPFKYSLAR
jgi:hypothetical protein